MKITKRQLRRIIREYGRSEHDAEARGMVASYRQGYSDAYRGPGFKRRGGDPEYRRGYEKGVADVEQGKPPPDDFRPVRRIREAEGSTKKYDDDSALRGKQSNLPDALQGAIINKTVEDREEREEEEREEREKEETNESFRTIRWVTKKQLRRLIRETLREGTLYVQPRIYGEVKITDDKGKEYSFGQMVKDLLSNGDYDIFQAPQGVDEGLLDNLRSAQAAGRGGPMEHWDSSIFGDYYNVDKDRVIRLYARRHNYSIEELEMESDEWSY